MSREEQIDMIMDEMRELRAHMEFAMDDEQYAQDAVRFHELENKLSALLDNE